MNTELRLLLIVNFGVLVAASWSLNKRWEWAHRALMAVCACLGIWAFTLFGDFHDHGVFGHQNFHAHDFYHYYFGSKYLKEWGYDGMYLATVTALEEIGREEPKKAIRFERIRDLRGSAKFMYRDEFMPLAEKVRAHFSPQRWSSLKKDLSFLRDKTPNNDWWHGVMLDNGFNPPPSYAVIGGAFSNIFPFNEHTWKVLGALDFLLLAIGLGVIGWAIGPMPALFALVIMGNTPITTYNWTGGSFLRQVWLFFLMLGLSGLAKRRWTSAGAALGACTAAVFFPAFFLFGAMAPLGYRFYRTGSRTALTRVAIGAAAAIAFLVVLSLLSYGFAPWAEWRERISAHGVTFFDNHLGLKKIVTFAPEVGRQAFGASDVVYPDWNRALVMRAARGHLIDLALATVLSLSMVAGCLRAPPAEASLVVGSGLLVTWTMPAGYYTLYVGVFAAFMLANRRAPWGSARFGLVAAALVGAILVRRFEHDLITQMVWLSIGWLVCILALSALYWVERPVLKQALQQRWRSVGETAAVIGALWVAGAIPRDRLHSADFLPPALAHGVHIADMLDVGSKQSEESHHMDIGEDFRQPRELMDTYGYRVKDECGILREGRALRYDLAPAPRGGHLIVRTDAFYRGELRTKINGRSLPDAHVEPHQSIFVYLQIPVPSDLGDEPLHVEQTMAGKDVGIFTVWLLE